MDKMGTRTAHLESECSRWEEGEREREGEVTLIYERLPPYFPSPAWPLHSVGQVRNPSTTADVKVADPFPHASPGQTQNVGCTNKNPFFEVNIFNTLQGFRLT